MNPVMKIIVTGGAGFIGSHIVDAYIKLGHRVAIIDNLSTGFRKNINPRAKFYRADIRDLEKIKNIFAAERPAVVNHHAAAAEVMRSLRDPKKTMAVNFSGTINLLLAGGETKIKNFIFASTGGALYGNPEKLPTKENAPLEPASPYGLSKVCAEEAVRFYSRFFGFDHVIFRYANVYGPRQNPKGEAGVVAIFGGLMRKGLRPQIFGNGKKIRDYVYVDDVARANVLALRRGKNDFFNIGLGRKIKDIDVFKTLSKELGFGKPPIYKPFRKGEVFASALRPSKIFKHLNWRPTTSFGEGIKRMTINNAE